jgi:hypothetical protein
MDELYKKMFLRAILSCHCLKFWESYMSPAAHIRVKIVKKTN